MHCCFTDGPAWFVTVKVMALVLWALILVTLMADNLPRYMKNLVEIACGATNTQRLEREQLLVTLVESKRLKCTNVIEHDWDKGIKRISRSYTNKGDVLSAPPYCTFTLGDTMWGAPMDKDFPDEQLVAEIVLAVEAGVGSG